MVFLFLMMFCSEVLASANIVINNVNQQQVVNRAIYNVTKAIPGCQVETINPYSLVMLHVESVNIGWFGATGTREQRIIFNVVPNGNDVVLSVNENCTIIQKNGMRETAEVGNDVDQYNFIKEIKTYFNGKYLFGYDNIDKKAGEGYVIGAITPGSAFDEAGIKAGDIMISINDVMVKKDKQGYLNGMLTDQNNPANSAKFVIVQNGKQNVYVITPKFYPGEYQGNNGETAPTVNNNTSNNENTPAAVAVSGPAPILPKQQVDTVDRKYTNGDHYVGEIDVATKNLQGKGVYTFANGDRYEGEFFANRIQGKGIFKYANGDSYEGEFKDSKYNGKGVLTHADGTKEEGNFVDGKYTGPASE